MTHERYVRIEQLFHQARSLPPEARRRLLDVECPDDPAVRAEVEKLLAAGDIESSLTDLRNRVQDVVPPLEGPSPQPAGGAQTASATTRQRGTRIGDYTIVRELGRGGFGVVYEAQQESPRRAVALKVIRGGQYVDDHRVRLFQREAQALARLRHPSIGAIYEAGRTDDGQHFFAMELVRGKPLMDHVRGGTGVPPVDHGRETLATALNLRDRLELFQRICDAIHYAHQKGVMHRDLKPSNVLIDAEGNPKILDFGLAKITDADIAVTTVVTEIGQIAGTLPYMSPEQARGHADEIDIRSDVYSLGVMLYELLTDQLPYDVSKVMLHEAVRMICEDPPRRPSTIIRSLRGDLETIALKALEKEPRRRYASAAALSEDVHRYLGDQPILARRPSAIYQLRKFARRNKVVFAAATAVIITLCAAIGITTWQAVRATRAEAKATAEAAIAGGVNDFFEQTASTPLASDSGEEPGDTCRAQ